MLMLTQIVGFNAASGFTDPVTAYSATLDTNLAGQENYSHRCAIPLSAAGTQVRVRFRGSSAASLTVDNASIGIRDTVIATVATPVELLFGGVSGFTVSAGVEIWSDWLDFIQSSATVVVIQDIGASNGACRYLGVASTSGWHERAAYNSYSEAAPSGFSAAAAAGIININAIEVRSAI